MRLRKLGINGIPKKDQLAQIEKINIWKWLFLGLVSLLVALGLVVQSRLATPREDVVSSNGLQRLVTSKLGP